MKIRIRLTLLYGLVFLIAGTLLIVISYALLDRSLPSNATNPATGQDLVNRAAKLADPSSNVTSCDSAGPKKTEATDPTPKGGGNCSPLTDAQRYELQQIAKSPASDAVKVAKQLGPKLGKSVTQMLLSGLPADVSSHTRSTMLRESLIGLIVSAVVAFALGWYVAGRALRPIQTIIDTAQQLSERNLDRRIALTGPDDELKHLANTFDAMLARLENAFHTQRRFVADASHELRTPLTIMRTELEVTLRHPDPERLIHMAHVVSDAVARSEQLVTSLLTLAASEHGPDDMTDVDLSDVARRAVAQTEATAQARRIHIESSLEQDATVEGDPALLDLLVYNLLDNAIRHNHDNGDIDISAQADEDTVTLTVANTGAVVPDDAIDDLFEPFHRLARGSTGRGGFGLGLAIVRSVTRAHHGEVNARANPAGGLTLTVTLPNRQPPIETPGTRSNTETRPDEAPALRPSR